ncbi:RNA-binding domain-containing protein [Calocera viscosa TUFC12733]|uniref:RNA-binding domain-containing protein n=1 Tax=Calocera viscosa (strain TUFC12733) TaxID=1330018 RepID=A0A167L7G7_CALVF|nr:RNA-binding domain-containing protein [Calocera viscosa TUFC12733]
MADVAMDVPVVPRAQRRSARNRGLPYARPAPRAPAVAATASSGSTRLLVSNLHYEVTEQDLRRLFSRAGALAKSPSIVFDRSGRSTGVAHITFTRHEDALSAKQRFDGEPAKGQKVSIRFEAALPASTPAGPGGAGKSLLARIGANPKASLLDRLGAPSAATTKTAPTGPRAAAGKPGPIRAPRGNRPARSKKAKPKTENDLDKELDAYLATDNEPQSGTADKAADVEMAA